MDSVKPQLLQNTSNLRIQFVEDRQGPAQCPEILDVLERENQYKIFRMALMDTGLDERLCADEGPFTVFAPTDEAFSRVPDLARLLGDRHLLHAVLLRHIVWGHMDSETLWGKDQVSPLNGRQLRLRREHFAVENANLVQPDVAASNGLVHGIGLVLMAENRSVLREACAAIEARARALFRSVTTRTSSIATAARNRLASWLVHGFFSRPDDPGETKIMPAVKS